MQNEKILKFIEWINANYRILDATFIELEGRPAVNCELRVAYQESFGVESEDLPPEDKWDAYCEQRLKMFTFEVGEVVKISIKREADEKLTDAEWMEKIRNDPRNLQEQMKSWDSPLGQHVLQSDLYKKMKDENNAD